MHLKIKTWQVLIAGSAGRMHFQVQPQLLERHIDRREQENKHPMCSCDNILCDARKDAPPEINQE